MIWQKAVFLLLIILVLSPLGSPALALALGFAYALTLGSPYPELVGRPFCVFLPASIGLLGLGANISELYRSGREAMLVMTAAVAGALVLGYVIGKALGVNDKIVSRLSAGAALGGSIIVPAAIVRSLTPSNVPPSIFEAAVNLGFAGITIALLFVGASLSREKLRSISLRPLALPLLIWQLISLVALVSVIGSI